MTISPLPIRVDVTTLPVETPQNLFSLLPPASSIAWVRNGEGLIAYGEYARLEVKGPNRFVEASAWWRESTSTLFAPPTPCELLEQDPLRSDLLRLTKMSRPFS